MKLKQVQEQITQFEDQIIETNVRADAFKKEYAKLEIQMERLRADISKDYFKDMSLNARANTLKDKVNLEKEKLLYNDLKNLNYFKSVLEKNLPKFIEQNNQIRY